MTALHKVLLHLSVASGLFSATPAVAGPQRPQVWVLLRNDARADLKLVDSAKAELARLYALIDVDLVWVTEIPTPEKRLHVICLVNGDPPGGVFPNPHWVIPRRGAGSGASWPMCSCGGFSEHPKDSKRESTSSLPCRLATSSVTCFCLMDLT